jgi:hypothetical protein
MKLETLRGYVLTGIASVVILAGVVLVFMNSGNTGKFHLYVRSLETFSTAWLMVLSAVGGLVLYWMARLLIRGIKLIRTGKLKTALVKGVDDASKTQGGN